VNPENPDSDKYNPGNPVNPGNPDSDQKNLIF